MPLSRPLLLALLAGGPTLGCAAPAPVVDTTPRPAPDLRGTRHDGADFRLDGLRGRVVALVFGYASCPEECPMTLASLAAAFRKLGPDADAVEGVFVTVDPQRDTVARLATYVPAFGARFHGVRAEGLGLARPAAALGVVYARGAAGRDGGYGVDHTPTVFLLDTEGNVRDRVPCGSGADVIAERLAAILPGVRAEGAWVGATPGGAAAAYLSVTVKADDRLLAVETDVAERAEVHRAVVTDGVARMAADTPALAAGVPMTLRPGGDHVMLLGVRHPLEVGDRVRLTLRFEKAGRLAVDAAVRGPEAWVGAEPARPEGPDRGDP